MKYDYDAMHMERFMADATVKYSKQQIKRLGRRLRKRNNEKNVARLANAQAAHAIDKRVARALHLAHMFLKGTPMDKAEDPIKTRTVISFEEIVTAAAVAVIVDEGEHEQAIAQRCSEWYDTWKDKRASR